MERTNNKIKTMKRQAYGFRETEFFKLKILAIHETKYAQEECLSSPVSTVDLRRNQRGALLPDEPKKTTAVGATARFFARVYRPREANTDSYPSSSRSQTRFERTCLTMSAVSFALDVRTSLSDNNTRSP
jgi:hypothetical protein